MKFKSILCTSVFCFAIYSCKTQTTKTVTKVESNTSVYDNYSYTTDSLLKHIKTLSSDAFEGRRTGTAGALKAKTYIIEALNKLDVGPLGAHYEQHFKFDKYDAVNVLGLIKGTEKNNKYIVISAHYDHEGVKNGKVYNGADDDASGVSALIAFAEHFKKNPPKHNVILAAFDAEELGLKGAYHFVKDNTIQQRNIVLNLNMDMISRSDKNELFAVGSRYYPKLKPAIDNYKKIGKANLLIGHEGLGDGDNWTYSSDHAAFHKAKIPFIYFGVADHEDYHKPTDDFERIDTVFYQDAVETILQVFKQYDALEL
ncbi:M20/M25/M40 family metallo-hydrolase [uncultured Lacinutrix sp.]|uniref:M20/M25/M40 family metallo-hydrolase n=1 Tax=uncultured Lacinutrix sp. TaxID=574032 RepID=UPI002620CF8B|nr:M20/M25/M40 family metallo-hydrolase [uncultured Lacinutrix sp.]